MIAAHPVTTIATASFPVGDWQFWVVTAIVASILGVVGWRLIQAGRRGLARRRGAPATTPVRTTLTIGGERPTPRRR